jgi:HK97 gp10 family phage protein
MDEHVTALRARIERGALEGLRATAEYALDRARHHAPVRAIFKRSRRGPATPVGWRTMRSAQRYEAFLRSRTRRKSMDIERGASYERRTGDLLGMAPEQTSAVRAVSRNRSGQRLGRRTTFAGHANTLLPVFSRGGYRFTGDLRRFNPLMGGMLGQLEPVPVVRQRGGRVRSVPNNPRHGVTSSEDESPGGVLQRSMLSGRGRYEVKHATSRGLFGNRVGGKLRGELRIRGPERHSGSWWMYVESPTEYAPYQEFGTSHNRPQPFLRPALYESRNVLRFEVRKAIDPRFNTLPE